MAQSLTSLEATIAAAGTVSDNVVVPNGKSLVGFRTPGVLVGTAFTFQAGFESTDTTRVVKKSDGNALTFTVAANGWYGLTDAERAILEGAKYLKVVSGTAETGGAVITLFFGKLQ